MIAIFGNVSDAILYANKVHEYLTRIRPNYNAEKWADPVESTDGLYAISQPEEETRDLWSDPIDTQEELSNSIDVTESLPDSGDVIIDKHYLYKGDIVKCRQTHQRTIYEPKDTPALFSFFRYNSDQLQWIENEEVEIGWMRIYNGVKYECIQAHQTLNTWTPEHTPALWKLYEDTPTQEQPQIEDWKPPTGGHDAYNMGDQVLFNGEIYESLINANVWSPADYPAGWKLI